MVVRTVVRPGVMIQGGALRAFDIGAPFAVRRNPMGLTGDAAVTRLPAGMHPLVTQIQLAQHPRHMGLHRRLAHEQLAGDLGVGEAAGDQTQDLELAFAQLGERGRACRAGLWPDPARHRPQGLEGLLADFTVE